MIQWNKSDLQKIAETDDLHIAPLRDDGVTYGTPTWIWSVVVDNQLFVRPYNGKRSSWYKAAISQKAGQIEAAGLTRQVNFEQESDDAVNRRIDDAYRTKYKGSPYLNAMIESGPRSATIKILPLSGE
ncbi:MAG: DUF2255 family protein [Candidatus Obscuribacterales bacterium]|nr:DUF2255 family protein [Candidatus Obscuribacterales bacterium]